MPPKKTTTAAAAAATNGAGDGLDGGKFQWEGQNEIKLLTLTQGRYVKPEEYEQLSSVFPGTTIGSIRNRISALRVKQRNIYESLGWQLPEGGAGHSSKKPRAKASTSTTTTTTTTAAAAKRAAGTAGLDDGVSSASVEETPSKKIRAKKAKVVKEVKEEVVSGEGRRWRCEDGDGG